MSDICKTNFGMLYDEDDATEMIESRVESNQLFQRYFKQRLRTTDLKLLCDTFELAKRVGLDEEKTWNYLRNSPYIYGQNLAFVEDTIHFIYSDKRDVSLDNWMSLVDIENHKSPVRKDRIKFKKMPVINHNDILMLWVRKNNGLPDMILFLYLILFETKKDD